MIDVANESVFPLGEAVAYYPRRNGRKPSFSTIWRHAARGSYGCRLETVRLPSGLYTSREAIARFITALTAAHAAEPLPPSPAPSRRGRPPRSADQRQRDIEHAEQRLTRAGI